MNNDRAKCDGIGCELAMTCDRFLAKAGTSQTWSQFTPVKRGWNLVCHGYIRSEADKAEQVQALAGDWDAMQ